MRTLVEEAENKNTYYYYMRWLWIQYPWLAMQWMGQHSTCTNFVFCVSWQLYLNSSLFVSDLVITTSDSTDKASVNNNETNAGNGSSENNATSNAENNAANNGAGSDANNQKEHLATNATTAGPLTRGIFRSIHVYI